MPSSRIIAVAVAACIVVAQAQDLPPWPLEPTVAAARTLAAAATLSSPTGLKRADYLPTIHGIVQYFRRMQNASGNIIDQYRGEETQYATPCFAFACATVWKEGFDATLLGNCTAALTAATREVRVCVVSCATAQGCGERWIMSLPPHSPCQLATKTCADGHCVFFMKPVMFAYRLLKPLVAPALVAQWDAYLSAMDPYKDFGFPVGG